MEIDCAGRSLRLYDGGARWFRSNKRKPGVNRALWSEPRKTSAASRAPRGAKPSDAQSVNPAGEAGDLPRRRVGMDDPFLRRSLDERLCCAQRFSRASPIACGDRLLDLADESPHLAAARPVYRGPAGNFADGLLGRRCVWHEQISTDGAHQSEDHRGPQKRSREFAITQRPRLGAAACDSARASEWRY